MMQIWAKKMFFSQHETFQQRHLCVNAKNTLFLTDGGAQQHYRFHVWKSFIAGVFFSLNLQSNKPPSLFSLLNNSVNIASLSYQSWLASFSMTNSLRQYGENLAHQFQSWSVTNLLTGVLSYFYRQWLLTQISWLLACLSFDLPLDFWGCDF